MRIRFDKIDWILKIYDGTRYLTLFGAKTYDAIYDRIRYLINLESSCWPIERTLTLHNAVIHIKSVLNRDKNHYYYKIFLEKCSYQLAKK